MKKQKEKKKKKKKKKKEEKNLKRTRSDEIVAKFSQYL